MSLMSAISLLTGVSLFIFGMILIKYSLAENFREKTERLMKKFVSGRISGVITGTAVTAALQSSSASSVLTAALVDNGVISLYNAFWLIVGANLGTSFTGLMTAVSFSDFAPAFCVMGIFLISFTKKKTLTGIGIFLTGFGLLFVGMDIMKNAVGEMKSSPFLYEILSKSDAPFTGLLTGSFFTALIQSSAAVTALLQTMAEDGIIGIRQAFYIILGSNIGTCATCLVASAGLGGGAKKVAWMHVLYNFFGSLIFVFLSLAFPLPEMAEGFFKGNIRMQIGFINVSFNFLSALIALLLPVKEKIKMKNNKNQHLHSYPAMLEYNR